MNTTSEEKIEINSVMAVGHAHADARFGLFESVTMITFTQNDINAWLLYKERHSVGLNTERE